MACSCCRRVGYTSRKMGSLGALQAAAGAGREDEEGHGTFPPPPLVFPPRYLTEAYMREGAAQSREKGGNNNFHHREQLTQCSATAY
jgi:hypothetical protein